MARFPASSSVTVWGPLCAVALYGAALASRAATLSSATFLNSDAPAAAYLGLAIPGPVSLPLHTEILPTLVEGALLGHPGGRLAIQLLGPVFALAMIAVLALTVSRVARAWVATLVAGLAAGPILLWSVLFPTAHVFSFLAAAFLAFCLTDLALGGLRPLLAFLCGAVAGVALMGDQAFLATGLAPMLAAAGALWLARHQRADLRTLALILGTAAAVVVAGEVALHAAGVRFVGDPIFAAVGVGVVPISTGLLTAARTIGQIAAGQWGATNLSQPWDAFTVVIGIAAIAMAPTALLRQLRRSGGNLDHARATYLFFWATADLLVLAAYLIFGYADSIASAHYLLPCFLSAVATLPFAAEYRWYRLPYLAAVLIAVVQAVGIVALPAVDYAGPHPPMDGQRVLAAIDRAGLTRGYADYWESNPLTWLSGEAVHVYPVVIQGCADSQTVCRYPYAAQTWYRPSHEPTFLVIRRSWACVSTSPSVLGPPQRMVVVDNDTTILIYGYDIASRFASRAHDACPE